MPYRRPAPPQSPPPVVYPETRSPFRALAGVFSVAFFLGISLASLTRARLSAGSALTTGGILCVVGVVGTIMLIKEDWQ